MINTDIDIDVYDRDSILKTLPCTPASMTKHNELVKHNSGVYFQEIPKNPYNDISTIEYETAEQLGYVKIDLLNNKMYGGVKNELHLVDLINRPVMWELLQHEEIVEKLYHINKYTHLMKRLKPDSIDKIAMILAIIRPAKSHLQNKSWEYIEKHVWEKESEDAYQFKRSHAYSYALALIVQLNLLVETL
jgi:hypothetical protein